MNTIKKSLLFSSLCLVPFFTMAANNISTSTPAKASVSTDKKQYFFIQNADEMTLQPGKLIVKHVEPNTLWFAGSPARDTGYLDMSGYMSLWDTPTAQFRLNSPNAVLEGYLPKKGNGKAQKITAVIVLKNANYNPVTKTLTYQIEKTYLLPDKKYIVQSVTIQQPRLWIDVAISLGSVN